MVATVEKAQAYKHEALNLYDKAQAKLDEYEGKEMPPDVFAEVNKIFDAADQKSKQAELTQRGAEAQVWKELPNDLKKLETPRGDLVPEEGNEFKWEGVMEKYGLRRWQVADVKDTIGSINRTFTDLREQVLKRGGAPFTKATPMVEATTTSGGFLTPDIYVPEFVNKLYLQSHLRQAGARIVPLRSDVTRYPKMTTASPAAALVAEVGAATSTNAVFGEQAFTAYMFRALQQASLELVADAEFDLLSEIILPDFAQQFAAAENSYYTVGTGSSQPEGIVTSVRTGSATCAVTTASVSFTTASNASFDQLIALMHKLPPQYRGSPKIGWMMNDNLIQQYRTVKAVSGGTYIWEPSQQVGQPDTLYGRPVYYNQTMVTAANVATATTAAACIPIIYGDFNYFWIGDRMGLDIRTASELYLANAMMGYFAFKRTDSHLMQLEAFACLLAT